jgi:hypothetical protein
MLTTGLSTLDFFFTLVGLILFFAVWGLQVPMQLIGNLSLQHGRLLVVLGLFFVMFSKERHENGNTSQLRAYATAMSFQLLLAFLCIVLMMNALYSSTLKVEHLYFGVLLATSFHSLYYYAMLYLKVEQGAVTYYLVRFGASIIALLFAAFLSFY